MWCSTTEKKKTPWLLWILFWISLIFSIIVFCCFLYCLNEVHSSLNRIVRCNLWFDLLLLFIALSFLSLIVIGYCQRVISEWLAITLCITIMAFLLGGIMYSPERAIIPIKSFGFGNCKCEFDLSRTTFIPTSYSADNLKLEEFFPLEWQKTAQTLLEDQNYKNELILLNCRQGDDFFDAVMKWHKAAINELELTNTQKEAVMKILIEDLIVISAAEKAISSCVTSKYNQCE